MSHKIVLLFLAVSVLFPLVNVSAQRDPDSWTAYPVNLRSGPGPGFAVITTLPSGVGLVFEARNADMAWLLAQTEDGQFRGWVAALYLSYREGFAAMRLPVSSEHIALLAAPAGSEALAAPSELAAQLAAIPLLSGVGPHAREIYLNGGKNPRVFSKIGDCNSYEWAFLAPFDTGQYDLGRYTSLQPSVDFFRGSFGRGSLAAQVGFNALSVLDAAWADPSVCVAGESPVWCELRRTHPAAAIIMFGANDVFLLSVEQYEQSLRQVVEWTLQSGTIPVLSTFTWCGTFNDHALALNLITVSLAREYDLPLINFWAAAQSLPNCGMLDGTHLTTAGPPYGAYFTGDEMRSGFTLRNLVTLQMLDELRRNVLY
jgi:hypothetical protein